MFPGTFEATSFWRTVLEKSFHLRERRIDGDGFSISTWKHPLFPVCISTPYRDRLALRWTASPRSLEPEELVALVKRRPVLLKDVGSFMEEDAPQGGLLRQEHTNSTVLLDDDLWRRMKRAARKNWRRATQHYALQLEVNPKRCQEEYYQLYLQTRRRLGVIPYRPIFFSQLFAAMGHQVVVFGCRHAGRSIGYLLCYLHDEEMISAHMAYDSDYQQMRVTDFLYINAFLWGRDHGYREYRFGGDYNNQLSLLAAKKKLGASSWSQYDYAGRAYSAPIESDEPESFVRQTLRRLPMPLFRHSGLLTHIYYA